MWRSTDDGWMQPSPSGSITIPPLSSCSRMCLSERTIGGAVYGAEAALTVA